MKVRAVTFAKPIRCFKGRMEHCIDLQNSYQSSYQIDADIESRLVTVSVKGDPFRMVIPMENLISFVPIVESKPAPKISVKAPKLPGKHG